MLAFVSKAIVLAAAGALTVIWKAADTSPSLTLTVAVPSFKAVRVFVEESTIRISGLALTALPVVTCFVPQISV